MPANPGFSHDAHFTPFVTGDLANPAVGIVDSFTKLLTVQLSTFPLGSSSGGFSYTLDPTLGTFKRASSSFGPAFAERALTVGKGRLSTGATYQFSTFSTFEGMDLEGGNIKFYLRHRECCTPNPARRAPARSTQPNGSRLSPFFEGDVIEAALSLKTHTQTMAFFGNYGLTDRWDIAMAIPVVRVELDADGGWRRSSGWRPARSRFTRSRPATSTRHSGPTRDPHRPRASATCCCGRSIGSSRAGAPGSPQDSTSGCPPATRRTCSAPAARGSSI